MNTPTSTAPTCPNEGKPTRSNKESMPHNKDPVQPKIIYFFKVQASWFPNCVPWGVLGQHNQFGRAGCFNKFLRETQKHSTWIRHKQTTGPKQSVSTWDFCTLTFNDTLSLQSWYDCDLKKTQKQKNMPLLLKHHLQYCKRNRWWCPTWLPGKSWRAWQEHVRIPLEVTVLI